MLVLRHFGINVAHYTGWQYEGLAGYAKPVKIAVEDLKPGDLIFYYANNSHVGIYIGDGKDRSRLQLCSLSAGRNQNFQL